MKDEVRYFYAVILLLILLMAANFAEKKPLPPSAPIISKHIDPSTLVWERASSTVPHWEKRDSHAVYVFDKKIWISGGIDSDLSKVDNVPDYEAAKYYNDIWNSPDGLVWIKVKDHAEFPTVRSHSVVYFKDALYMIGGWSPTDGLVYKNGIWRSVDGSSWTKVVSKPEYPEREGQKVIEFKGRLWMIGGVDYFARKTFNDVWVSDDATHWSLATSSAPWHSRWDHDVSILHDKLWLMGGMNFNGIGYGDEWVSDDGVHWELVTELASWGKRQGQGAVTLGKYMWLISGLDSKTNEGKGDAWYTEDGINWRKATSDDQWLGREDHGVIVFDNKIWVLGGMDSNWHWNDDIWYSTFKEVQ